ncbi:outer membrane protein [Phreatobacter oligotrophus]|uniref:outer membrane protein n=1 Tax=Phreatobacter oligotrophus TaxID=1122261 RepID=UPI00235782C5|nr:outer membrane beta-barrel protein [Phreatobacter oligotrophus]MBX9990588.1 outer membrane beta-barrel protein [Phreatobacter oligotrophus]
MMSRSSLAAALALAASGVHAADLGVPRQPVDAAVIAPVFDWSGLYAGIQGGYAGSHQTWTVTFPGQFRAGWAGQGGLVGLHVGVNRQIGRLVLGLQADINAGVIAGSMADPPVVFASRANLLGALEARVGIATDRFLIYATGGAAGTDARHSFTLGQIGPVVFRQNWLGWTVGGGAEYAFGSGWTARLEYRFADFGSRAYPATPVGGNGVISAHSHRQTIQTVRLGLSYLFSTGPAAVSARY